MLAGMWVVMSRMECAAIQWNCTRNGTKECVVVSDLRLDLLVFVCVPLHVSVFVWKTATTTTTPTTTCTECVCVCCVRCTDTLMHPLLLTRTNETIKRKLHRPNQTFESNYTASLVQCNSNVCACMLCMHESMAFAIGNVTFLLFSEIKTKNKIKTINPPPQPNAAEYTGYDFNFITHPLICSPSLRYFVLSVPWFVVVVVEFVVFVLLVKRMCRCNCSELFLFSLLW